MLITKRVHDPISLFISNINYGIRANKKCVFVSYHATILNLTTILMRRGYISAHRIYKMVHADTSHTCICIWLTRYQNKNVMTLLKAFYKPSQRLSKTYMQLSKIKHKEKCEMLLSTSIGFRWLDECLHLKIGGVLLFEIL